MIFGPMTLAEADGAILAHSLRVGGTLLTKGRVLTAADCARLSEAGVAQIVAARLEPGDVGEDEAAAVLAEAASGPHVVRAAALTGRVNVYAAAAGLALIDRAAVDAVNAVHESLTIATLQPFARVSPRQMLATVKIIPFAAPRAALDQACALLRGRTALRVAPFAATTVALISTILPGQKPELAGKNRVTLEARLAPLGATLCGEERVAHETGAVTAALRNARAAGADIALVYGASAIVDRRDVVPAALEAAGGSIARFGMPVDPGNLLMAGTLGAMHVVGLPGCARSPKRNGFDWVLERLVARESVGASEIAGMGVGGLLAEIASRPQPRERAPSPAEAPKIAAVVLAAGLGRRMGGENKLLRTVGGEPLVRRSVARICASAAAPVIVVTGHEAAQTRDALAGLDVTVIDNAAYRDGLASSLKAGLAALPDDADGVLVCLADMPDIAAADLDRLVAAFAPEEGRSIVVPTADGKRGNPVLWGRAFLPEMMALAGDTGAKHLIGANEDVVCEVEIGAAALRDLDTLEAFARFEEGA